MKRIFVLCSAHLFAISSIFLFGFCKKEDKAPSVSVKVINQSGQAVSNAKVRFYVNSERVDSLNKKVLDTFLFANEAGEVYFKTDRECYLDIKCYNPQPQNNTILWCDTFIHFEPNSDKKITMIIK